VRTLAIVFRGTDQVEDILTDYFDFKTHFAKFEPLISKVLAYAKDTGNGIKQVLVSGHSLGAAMVDYFLSELPSDPPYTVKAYTDGYPGVEAQIQIADGLANNFIHTDDAVFGLGELSNLPLYEKAAVIAAITAPLRAGETVIGDTAAVLVGAALASIEAKSHEGNDIFLNSDLSSTWSFEEHHPQFYVADVQKLVAFATDPESVFYKVRAQSSIYELGQALKTNDLYHGPSIQIGVGQQNSTLIHIDGNDDVDLGRVYGSKGLLAPQPVRFIWSDNSHKVHYVDGGDPGPGAVNTVVINSSPADYSWQTIYDSNLQSHVELSYSGIVVGELYRIGSLEFRFGAGRPSRLI
jgi:hypothetical protein